MDYLILFSQHFPVNLAASTWVSQTESQPWVFIIVSFEVGGIQDRHETENQYLLENRVVESIILIV